MPPAATAPLDIDGATGLIDVACPAATECTALDAAGNEETFTVSLYQYPTGVNWSTASAAELQEYGLPEAPPASAGLEAAASWDGLVDSISASPPAPPFLEIGTDTSDTEGSYSWSGYLANDKSAQSAVVGYTQPRLQHDACPGNAVSIWAGVGGWNRNPDLGQDGTASGDTGLAPREIWEEVLPSQPTMVGLNAKIPAGAPVNAFVEWDSGEWTGQVQTMVGNHRVTRGWSKSGPWTGGTAEAIVESPAYQKTLSNGEKQTWLTPLSNVGTVHFSGSGTFENAMSGYAANGGRLGLNGYDTATNVEMATAGPLSEIGQGQSLPGRTDPGGIFSDTEEHCGGARPAPNASGSAGLGGPYVPAS